MCPKAVQIFQLLITGWSVAVPPLGRKETRFKLLRTHVEVAQDALGLCDMSSYRIIAKRPCPGDILAARL